MSSPVGYAISDCAKGQRRLSTTLFRLGFPHFSDIAIELQPEKGIWKYGKLERNILNRVDFLSVHTPTQNGVDISSPDEEVRRKSIEMYQKRMDLTDDVGAKVLVLHPIQQPLEEFLTPGQRIERFGIFGDVFREHLVPYHRENEHSYGLGIENLEYSGGPSTLEETARLTRECTDYYPEYTYMVLDIPHILHSYSILREKRNSHLRDDILGYPRKERSVVGDVASFIDDFGENITHYHVANYRSTNARTDGPLGVYINQDLRRIIPYLGDKPVILEIQNEDLEALKRSRERFIDVLKRGGYG